MLEGGYHTEHLPKNVQNFVNGINGDKLCYEERQTDSMTQTIDEFEHRMDDLRNNLCEYWKL